MTTPHRVRSRGFKPEGLIPRVRGPEARTFTREGESSTVVTPSRQHAAVVVSLIAYAMADTGWSVQCSRQAVVRGLDPYHQTFAASRTPVNIGRRMEAHRANRGEGGTPLAAAAVGAWIRCDARA